MNRRNTTLSWYHQSYKQLIAFFTIFITILCSFYLIVILKDSDIERQTKMLCKRQKQIQLKKTQQNVHIRKNGIDYGHIYQAKQYRRLKNEKNEELGLKQYNYYDKKYGIGNYTQLPFCIVITGYMINKRNYVENNLDSVFSQNYSNYHVTYYDDASTDGTYEAVLKYVEQHPNIKHKIKVHQNKVNVKSLSSLVKAAFNDCKPQQIFMIVDADDQLIGRQVLKLFNVAFHKGAYYAYSAVFTSEGESGGLQYSQKVLQKNTFRDDIWRASHPLTIYTQMLRRIEDCDLRDLEGNYFLTVQDVVVGVPTLQMAGGKRIQYLPQLTYYYNSDTGLNDGTIRRKTQDQHQNLVRSYPKYNVLQDWSPEIQQRIYNLEKEIKQINKQSQPQKQSIKIIEKTQQKINPKEIKINNYTITQQQIFNAKQYRKLKNSPKDRIFRTQEKYYHQKYNVTSYKELPFCVVMINSNSNIPQAIQDGFNSVFTQNYTKYRFVFINDLNLAQINKTLSSYLHQHPRITKVKGLQIVHNNSPQGKRSNYLLAAQKYCKKDEIMLMMEGGDYLVGRQVLKLYNAVFQGTKSYYVFSSINQISFSEPYPNQIMDSNEYRKYPFIVGPLRAFYTTLLLKVGQLVPSLFKDQNGNKINSMDDVSVNLALLQLSHKKVQYIPELNYQLNPLSKIMLNHSQLIRYSEFKTRKSQKLSPIQSLFDFNPFNQIGFSLQQHLNSEKIMDK